jgi:acetolactate synthase-1/2/3 large subunit
VRLADVISARIERAGVRHVFGVSGANIEDVFAAVQRRRPHLSAVLTKHEHGAGTAADAYARISGGLGVVLATSGGGAMNLVHSLAEAMASRVPVLALVGEPPRELQGCGAFQDTSGRCGAIDAAAVFRAVSVWCARAERAGEVPALLERAIATALGRRGPAVLLLEKNLQRAEVDADPSASPDTSAALPTAPAPAALDRAVLDAVARRLSPRPILIIAGDQVARAGAQAALAQIAERLSATVAVTPDARDAFDNTSGRFLGVAGAMGHARVVEALQAASVCLLIGTQLPWLARHGLEPLLAEKVVLSLGRGAPFISPVPLHVEACPRALCAALLERLPPPATASAELRGGGRSRRCAEPAPARFDMPAVLARLERELDEGGVVIVDAGNTGASTAHHLRAPSSGRWLLAMGMAGMGYSFGAAIGAACASGKRCLVCAGDGAFFMHGLELHTAVQYALPITFVVFDNRAHGMCLLRERLLLGEEHGHNQFARAHLGAGLAAMFPGLPSHDCASFAELERALDATRSASGPVLLSIELAEVEIPPFAALEAAARARGVISVRGGHEQP